MSEVLRDFGQGPHKNVDDTPAGGGAGMVLRADVAAAAIDIDGVDRQACGGTHLSNTGQSRPIRITKVENKGRHNRRVRFRFTDS